MSTVAEAPPVRHGKCRLCLVINEYVYSLVKVSGRLWRLTKVSGPRAGSRYEVCRTTSNRLVCTCYDYTVNQAECKHVRAILAARLLPRPKGGAR